MSGTKAAIASIAFGLAAVLAVKLGYFLASLPLIAIAALCFRHAVIATKAMREFYQASHHQQRRMLAHRNPNRIYL
jgi:hypothetical protein